MSGSRPLTLHCAGLVKHNAQRNYAHNVFNHARRRRAKKIFGVMYIIRLWLCTYYSYTACMSYVYKYSYIMDIIYGHNDLGCVACYVANNIAILWT